MTIAVERAVNTIAAWAERHGLTVSVDQSRQSEAHYLTVGLNDDDARPVKIRVATHDNGSTRIGRDDNDLLVDLRRGRNANPEAVETARDAIEYLARRYGKAAPARSVLSEAGQASRDAAIIARRKAAWAAETATADAIIRALPDVPTGQGMTVRARLGRALAQSGWKGSKAARRRILDEAAHKARSA